MTALERRKPELIKATRKRRIAAGAGVQVQDVNRLLKEFEQMQDMMKKMRRRPHENDEAQWSEHEGHPARQWAAAFPGMR
jgi:signal recognition particle subunit SRP54